MNLGGFPGGSVVNKPIANAGDAGSIPAPTLISLCFVLFNAKNTTMRFSGDMAYWEIHLNI